MRRVGPRALQGMPVAARVLIVRASYARRTHVVVATARKTPQRAARQIFCDVSVEKVLPAGAGHVVVATVGGAACTIAAKKPFDADFAHDTATNVKQMRQWQKLYQASGATTPDCWPGKIIARMPAEPRFDKATRASNPAKGLVHYLGRLKKARWRGSARKIAKFGLKVQKYNQLVVAAVVVSTS